MAGEKILVVDDEAHIVHVVSIKLRNNGFEVMTAGNGQEAFTLACEEKPDVIITDFQMPIMSGMELLAELRGNETTKDIPVIMLTARSFAVDDQQKQSLRIFDCISKPFSPKELLRIVEDALYQKAMTNKI